MPTLTKLQVAAGIYWVEIPGAGLRVLCGCPADAVKHLARRGLIVPQENDGRLSETGPNAILLSDLPVQNGQLANLAEFPVLQMLYRQGMLLPGHPGNTGLRPLLIGSARQLKAQLRYIHRGNYGLLDEAELAGCGLSEPQCREALALKRRFAYGRLLPPSELLESVAVRAQPTRVRNGVTVRRLQQNVFEFASGGCSVSVDLNLGPQQTYPPPYHLGCHQVAPEYFSVVHCGDGNGWDADRPCMSSLLVFQGRFYLIDAGPNLDYLLRALGIGLNEIEGIFHTHAHDDHFCGLTTLVRSDHRLKYFATPCVRASMSRKLAALLSIHEQELTHLLDFRDLRPQRWNEVAGLQVRPVPSPHPVETTILQFRVPGAEGYRTYAHYADLISLSLLKRFASQEGGLPAGLYERVRREYLARADVKKVDVGGGDIHGEAEDFRRDRSPRLLLSHLEGEPTERQKQLGSRASFGATDVLIPARLDYLRRRAGEYLRLLYPAVPERHLEELLNCPLGEYGPDTVLLRTGEVSLLLSGEIEVLGPRRRRLLSTGSLIGDDQALGSMAAAETYRTTSFVRLLQIPAAIYRGFVRRNRLAATISSLRAGREFLQSTWLFGERLSYPVCNTLARGLQGEPVAAGVCLQPEGCALHLVRHGRLEMLLDDQVLELLGPGDFFGTSTILHGTRGLFRFRALEPAQLYRLPGELLQGLPVVRWKLFETYERRLRKALNPEALDAAELRWREQYRTGIAALDDDHQAFFAAAGGACQRLAAGLNRQSFRRVLSFLAEYADAHFAREETLLQAYDYPELQRHRQEHQAFRDEVAEFDSRAEGRDRHLGPDLVEFVRDWIANHLLTEDQRYGGYLRERGVR